MRRALAVAVALSASAPLACECKKGSPESKVETADAVFEAVVASVSEDGDDWLVKVNVARRWKGADSKELTLRARTGKRCGYFFAPGKAYVVFAMRDGPQLRVTTCGKTTPIEKAAELIATLPPPLK